ncbi:MarR family transcriptional regulator [Dermacoccus nishinomiyaensis]|uniref:MarR family transcriptional regulator n=1 Tax=Dermacoccus nishinomiyaensis TaxID=1274 RepID=UPI0033AB6121
MSKGTAQGGFWYAEAVRNSDLPSLSRLVALVLVGIADNASGEVTVSLGALETFTGMSRSSVAKHLNNLEAGGWLRRIRAPGWKARTEHASTRYVTIIPNGYSTKRPPHREASASGGLGLVRESVEASAPDGLGLVRESVKASPSGAPSTTGTRADRGSGSASAPPPPAPAHDSITTGQPEMREVPEVWQCDLTGAEGILALDNGTSAIVTITSDDGRMVELRASDGSEHRLPRDLSIRRHVLKIFDDTIKNQEQTA